MKVNGTAVIFLKLIFDTEDLAKERPKADTVLVATNEEKDRIWIDADHE